MLRLLTVAGFLALSASAAMAGKSLPFEGGLYVPTAQASTCSDPNVAVYDWSVGINSKKGTFGGSDGVCEIVSVKAKGSTYITKWSCASLDETSTETIKITTAGPGGKVTKIDGEPYTYCGPN